MDTSSCPVDALRRCKNRYRQLWVSLQSIVFPIVGREARQSLPNIVAMFYAFLCIVLSLLIVISGISISAVDMNKYNFGLYFALLGLVGLISGAAICVARPESCSKGPKWYRRLCRRVTSPCKTFCRSSGPCMSPTTEDGDEERDNSPSMIEYTSSRIYLSRTDASPDRSGRKDLCEKGGPEDAGGR